MKVPCYHCNVTTDLQINFDVVDFVCPNCYTVYRNETDGLKFHSRFDVVRYPNKFSVGQKALLKGEEYVITGLLIKKGDYSFQWAEYVLQNKKGDFLYLSEADGHWILLNEVVFDKKVGNHPKRIDFQGQSFDIYEYSNPKVVSAQGYFDFNINTKIELVEYINPPYLVSVERSGNEQTTFFGEHISKKEVQKAFGKEITLPEVTGIGLVQPFWFHFKNTAITFCLVAILILLTHSFLNGNRQEKNILNQDIPYDGYINKDYVTPSFELKGSSAPLVISVASNVDNSWANVQVALINETTGEEVYANKDIEYYHGYEDGESWTEGNTNEEFNICGVSEGKYHLSLTPMKAPEDVSNNYLHVDVSWNKPSLRNVWMTVLFMGVFIVILYYLNKYFETRRWEDSSYSPYVE